MIQFYAPKFNCSHSVLALVLCTWLLRASLHAHIFLLTVTTAILKCCFLFLPVRISGRLSNEFKSSQRESGATYNNYDLALTCTVHNLYQRYSSGSFVATSKGSWLLGFPAFKCCFPTEINLVSNMYNTAHSCQGSDGLFNFSPHCSVM